LASAALVAISAPALANVDLSYLRGLLDTTPAGGWVQVNANRFSDAWNLNGPGALPDGSYSDPSRVARAWSSFAWDSRRGQLYLYGGGHANYMGNEMYVWQGSTGLWTRGSLPSRMERYGNTATFFTVDDAAPQSAHTYDNTVYLPVNDRYLIFGGAAFNSGGAYVVRNASGDPVRAGPWLWDPSKADPNKVGGTDGSGYEPSSPGGNMWSNQQGRWTGTQAPDYIESNTAYLNENGKDVVYVASAAGGSGRQDLYRYELGDVSAGEFGSFQKVGTGDAVVSFQSAATIDSHHGLYIRTAAHRDFYEEFKGFGVWQLANNNAANPGANQVQYVELRFEDGAQYAINRQHGIAFDEFSGKILLWDGRERGTLYETEAAFDNDGRLLSTWTVRRLLSATDAQPNGNFMADASNESGVLGKFHFVSELGAFIALDQYSGATMDAGVWLYKPLVAVIPEPTSVAMLLTGLGLIAPAVRRRRIA
jgi:hypothetical protein